MTLDEFASKPFGPARRTVLRALVTLLGAAAVGRLGAPRPARADDPATEKWICTNGDCRPYIYDPQVGDDSQGIPPGIAFEDLPDDWYCPDCGATKVEFIRYFG